jgi:hypothetical protein
MLARQPWVRSTGPQSEVGKKRAAENGRKRQKAEKSVRQLRAELAPIVALVRAMGTTRNEIARVFQQSSSLK